MIAAVFVAAMTAAQGSGIVATGPVNDYPTEARSEYVFACMASNGQTRKALSECSCAIDHIASVLDYDDYVAAETVLTMRQTAGQGAELFRETTFANEMVLPLRAAEAESEILCFTPGDHAPRVRE